MAIPQHFITNNAKIKKRIITKKLNNFNILLFLLCMDFKTIKEIEALFKCVSSNIYYIYV